MGPQNHEKLKVLSPENMGGITPKTLKKKEPWVPMVFYVVVSNGLYFHPYLDEISNLTNIFQMGWNHQLSLIIEPRYPQWSGKLSSEARDQRSTKAMWTVGSTQDVWQVGEFRHRFWDQGFDKKCLSQWPCGGFQWTFQRWPVLLSCPFDGFYSWPFQGWNIWKVMCIWVISSGHLEGNCFRMGTMRIRKNGLGFRSLWCWDCFVVWFFFLPMDHGFVENGILEDVCGLSPRVKFVPFYHWIYHKPITMWVFPKIMVPPNHPFVHRVFPEINQPF